MVLKSGLMAWTLRPPPRLRLSWRAWNKGISRTSTALAPAYMNIRSTSAWATVATSLGWRKPRDANWRRYEEAAATGHCGSATKLGVIQTKEETGDSITMPLTRDFKETIRARAKRDRAFRNALLRESVECVSRGDLATGKAVLRDYVNATVGFQNLEKRTLIPAKSRMRMLGPKGSPSAANLSRLLAALQKTEGVQMELSLKR
jgi:hypothetical protein